MPTKSMFSRPIGIFLVVVASVIGVIYVMYPSFFNNEEGESFIEHPVPPRTFDEETTENPYPKGYHYQSKCGHTK